MAWSYRKRVTIFPGVRINLSGSGISTTFGIPGASVNIGKDGAFINTGIPGTGFYSRHKIYDWDQQDNGNSDSESFDTFLYRPKGTEIKSKGISELSSVDFESLRQTIIDSHKEVEEIQKQLTKSIDQKIEFENKLKKYITFQFLKRIFEKKYLNYTRYLKEANESIDELNEQRKLCAIQIESEISDEIKNSFGRLIDSFTRLTRSAMIWDITKTEDIDYVKERSQAKISVTRVSTKAYYDKIDLFQSEYNGLWFKNTNGPDIILYPWFIVFYKSKYYFSLISYKDIAIKFTNTLFHETEKVPNDCQITGKTWAKVNKDGSRDKRYSGNYEIPICKYGEIEFKTNKGLYEVFMFSNYFSAENYYNFLSSYIDLFKTTKEQPKQPKLEEKIIGSFNYFELELSSTQSELQDRYYALLKKYHPDTVNQLPKEFIALATEKTKEINYHYSVLKKYFSNKT